MATKTPQPNPFSDLAPAATIEPTIIVEPRPAGEALETMLHELRGRPSVAIKFIQSQPGRRDHTRPDHVDLCGVEMALADLQTALKNRK
jgi:hypothetical protein